MRTVRGQQILLGLALEAQQQRRGKVSNLRRRAGIGRHMPHGDQLRAESIAPIGIAQTVELQIRGGNDLFETRCVQRRAHLHVVGGEHPVTDFPHLPRARDVPVIGLAGAREHQLRHTLGGIVVVIAHLSLALLQRTVGNRAFTAKQIRV